MVAEMRIRQQKLHVVHRPDPGSTATIRIALLRERDGTYPLWPFTSSLTGLGPWMGMFVATLAKRRI
jgi:hypothetical protein